MAGRRKQAISAEEGLPMVMRRALTSDPNRTMPTMCDWSG